MTRLLLLLLILTGTYTLPAQTDANCDELGFDPVRLARVDAYMQGLVDQGVIPNAQVLILRRGQTAHRGSFGYSDLEKQTPAQPDDIYRIASMTKAQVTVGLMMEYEKGKFLLDDPVSQYIPAFAGAQVLTKVDKEQGTYETEPAKSPVTIRQLLTHTAGIAYGLEVETDDIRVPYFASLDDVTTEAVANRIAKRPLVHHPGEGFTYGLGIDVAGRLLEVVSGQSLNDYLTEHLWRPLGMTDSYFYLPAEKHSRLVKLYSKKERDSQLTPHENETYNDFAIRGAQRYYSGGAGSVGTIKDYGTFCQMLLNEGSLHGHRFLSPHTVRMMTRPHTGDFTVWERNDPFGIGFQIISEQSRYGGLATPGAYTWGGLYLTEFTIDPAEELVMLFYTNVQPIPQYQEIVRRFRNLVYAALVD